MGLDANTLEAGVWVPEGLSCVQGEGLEHLHRLQQGHRICNSGVAQSSCLCGSSFQAGLWSFCLHMCSTQKREALPGGGGLVMLP